MPMNVHSCRYKLYLENEDDEVGAVMETGSVEDEEEGKENQQPAGGRRRAGSVRMGTRVLAARERRAEVVTHLLLHPHPTS